MIKAENLTRKYGEIVAVNEASFQIEHGEIVGLLGHNGAGKTTIMKMITGYIEPTGGTLTVDGLDILEDRGRIQKKIGYLPENCPLYPDMTVVDYLIFASSLKGLSGGNASQSIRSAIKKTKLTDVAGQRVQTLSRGYRQRLGVAQAILGEPKIYILDEPTNGLDPSQIQEMRTLIEELAKKATVVVSTHILQEVQATCNRVIIIRAGKVAMDSPLANLYSSNRLEIDVNKNGDDSKDIFQAVEGVKVVESIEKESKETFILEIDEEKDNQEVASLIAKQVVDKGLKLYSMQPNVRDLETIFGEISEGSTGAGDE